MNPNGNASPMDGLPLQPGSNWIRRDDYHGFSSFSTAWYISYSMKWYIRFSIIIGSFFYQSPFSGRLPCYVRVRGNRTTNQSNALISRYNYVFINCHSWKQFDHLDPLKTGYFTTHVSTLLPSFKKKTWTIHGMWNSSFRESSDKEDLDHSKLSGWSKKS